MKANIFTPSEKKKMTLCIPIWRAITRFCFWNTKMHLENSCGVSIYDLKLMCLNILSFYTSFVDKKSPIQFLLIYFLFWMLLEIARNYDSAILKEGFMDINRAIAKL